MRYKAFKVVKVREDGVWEGVGLTDPLPKMTLTEVDPSTGKDIRKMDLGGETDLSEIRFSASPSLLLIGEAWMWGCDFEDLADGYGAGVGTHGDWSGIRDSSKEAVDEMLTRALNFLWESLQEHHGKK